MPAPDSTSTPPAATRSVSVSSASAARSAGNATRLTPAAVARATIVSTRTTVRRDARRRSPVNLPSTGRDAVHSRASHPLYPRARVEG